jgi:hypothetical protein
LSAMTLDEYRLQVFEKLKACTEASRAREILADVQGLLAYSRMSDSGQKAFWHSLNHDLNVLAHELRRESEESAGNRGVIATAQATIAQYQRKLKSDG